MYVYIYYIYMMATSYKTAAVRPLITNQKKLSKLDEPDMQETAGEVKTNL